MAVETANRVRTGSVVIEIDVADHRRRTRPERRRRGCLGCTSAKGTEETDTTECGNAERQAHGFV